MEKENLRCKELSDFLKTRRARILPSQAGLPSAGRRRTPGLRREEVSQLAGIGLTWYTWLEQGRPIHVSSSVIESLSRVLLLDRQEREHLYMLANQPLPVEIPGYEGTVNPIYQHVLDNLALCPSFIADPRWNVVAWNKAACVIFGDFTRMNARQRNIVWAMFTDPYFRQLYTDWYHNARSLVGRFRSSCGKYIDDPWLVQFIDELKTASPEFNQWWILHDIQDDSGVYKELRHPAGGILNFESTNYIVPDSGGLRLFVHVPAPGTTTAENMRRLVENTV
ncbi:MAG: helix-turn-helix domain-containing protein [Chloroflexi bacterium]|nr:helix-turn-helix domain-containing protein [Chloroflexota bacterium]